MTRPSIATNPTNGNPPLSRAERKAALLAELEQQRIDILVASNQLIDTSAPLDNNWQRLKLPVYMIGGVVAFRVLRHPGSVMTLGRKALAGYMLLRKFKLLAKITS
ncbi:YqjK family protein [Vreelandella zhaodongensis]|uniref:YqjK family protein n=1 Tax=Vreelandella zhaodongensis TaxID=1176240 RepID=UPI003EBA9FE3